MFEIYIWAFVLIIIGCLIVGFIAGFFLVRIFIKKEIDKNPPFNEEMIKAMYSSMGVTPNQKRINQTMNAIRDAQKKSKK